LTTFNNSVVKPFIIAEDNALSHLGRGDFDLPVCPTFFRRGDFVRFPILVLLR